MWRRGDGYVISMNKDDLDRDVIHQFLSEESYWAQGIERHVVEVMIENTPLCYGVYHEELLEDGTTVRQQVGLARVVTDFVRFSWLADVFILPEHRGKELSKWLLSCVLEHPQLKGTRFGLSTDDAHGLYEQFGFKPIDKPENRLERPLDWGAIRAAYSYGGEQDN
ncbi:GNAT family N-acetyltransferase [Fictibacillus iocasae]|uniref:GNAT family N-acetyltransferase n=1 Tax=Fictibacillus iocasae TaxID=2715437 RepID=A0ABW2NUS6_9BACL